MKLYLVAKELSSLSRRISFQTPVYIDATHLFAGFCKRTDGFIIPKKKKDTGEWYQSNLAAVNNCLKNIKKLRHNYLDYELVLTDTNCTKKAKFIYDGKREIILLIEDSSTYTTEQFDRFCRYYQIKRHDKLQFQLFMDKKIIIVPKTLAIKLEGILRLKINGSNPYLIPLLITKINKF